MDVDSYSPRSTPEATYGKRRTWFQEGQQSLIASRLDWVGLGRRHCGSFRSGALLRGGERPAFLPGGGPEEKAKGSRSTQATAPNWANCSDPVGNCKYFDARVLGLPIGSS